MKKKAYCAFTVLLLLCAVALLQGCSELIVLNPKGPIGQSERFLIIISFVLMLLVVVPVIVMSLWFPLKYRSTNKKAHYDPNWCYSKKIEIAMWLIPIAIVSVLSFLAWRDTHRLDPYLPLKSDAAPLHVKVVSLDWKWLFIYPEQNIAVVNEFVFPAKVPLSFQITSDTVMTSFFIPQLGSQIYAMAGMETKLHLMADEPGEYIGQNQQFSGAGYPAMTFKALADSKEHFDAWVQQVKQSPQRLDLARFKELQKPSASVPVLYFSSVDPELFDYIIHQYNSMTMDKPTTGDMPHSGHGQ